MLDSQETIARIVRDHSECAPVFQRYHLDFCCHGNVSLEAACTQRQVDLSLIMSDLTDAITRRRDDSGSDPQYLSTPALVEYIVSNYHESLRKVLPFIEGLAAKVVQSHGSLHPQLEELDSVVRELVAVITPHLQHEEQKLFPELIVEHPDRQVLARELASMQHDHLAVTRLLKQLRGVTDNFQIPGWACNSYRTLSSELKEIEQDLLRHTHLEDHVLFPRFMTQP
jgi:regulator of cell morphogenesis and NO signaling